MTTWQKIIAITLSVIIGAIVGYIVIRNNLEKVTVPTIQDDRVDNAFNQYVENSNANTVK